LNVNANPPDDDGWKRAYHREWLGIATDRVAPFVEVAHLAFLVKMAAKRMSGEEFLKLDTGSKNWDSLPVFGEPILLPGGKNE
jgi:hypothetical protein